MPIDFPFFANDGVTGRLTTNSERYIEAKSNSSLYCIYSWAPTIIADATFCYLLYDFKYMNQVQVNVQNLSSLLF